MLNKIFNMDSSLIDIINNFEKYDDLEIKDINGELFIHYNHETTEDEYNKYANDMLSFLSVTSKLLFDLFDDCKVHISSKNIQKSFVAQKGKFDIDKTGETKDTCTNNKKGRASSGTRGTTDPETLDAKILNHEKCCEDEKCNKNLNEDKMTFAQKIKSHLTKTKYVFDSETAIKCFKNIIENGDYWPKYDKDNNIVSIIVQTEKLIPDFDGTQDDINFITKKDTVEISKFIYSCITDLGFKNVIPYINQDINEVGLNEPMNVFEFLF